MKLYKKVVPYVLTGAAMLMTGCGAPEPHKDIIVAKQDGTIYLDSNGDGDVDRGIRFHGTDTASHCFYNYAMVGDTLEYYVSKMMDWDYQRVVGSNNIGFAKINGYKETELSAINRINQLRSEIGQKKTRTL